MSAGTPNNTAALGYIVPCSTTDLRQRWRSSGVPFVTYQDVSTPYYYGVIASGGSANITTQNFIGHSWSGVVKVIKNERKKFVNGVYNSTEFIGYQTDRGSVSGWPAGVPAVNKSEDLDALTKFISGNPDSTYSYRLKTISESQYNNFVTYSGQTNCSFYPLTFAVGVVYGDCNCTQVSLKFWTLLTGETVSTPQLVPLSLRNSILNTQGGQSAVFTKP